MLFAVSVVLCLLSLGGIVYFIGKLVREDRRRRDEEVRSRWQPPLDDEECCYPIRPEPQANDLMETVLMASAISDAFNAPAAEYVPERLPAPDYAPTPCEAFDGLQYTTTEEVTIEPSDRYDAPEAVAEVTESFSYDPPSYDSGDAGSNYSGGYDSGDTGGYDSGDCGGGDCGGWD